jgi:hypothetical protein
MAEKPCNESDSGVIAAAVPAPMALSRRIKITYRSAAAMSLCRNSSTSPMRILHWQTAALLFT